MELEVLAVPQNRDHKSSRSGHSNRNINIVPPHNLIAIDDGIDNGVLLEGEGGSPEEEGHEP